MRGWGKGQFWYYYDFFIYKIVAGIIWKRREITQAGVTSTCLRTGINWIGARSYKSNTMVATSSISSKKSKAFKKINSETNTLIKNESPANLTTWHRELATRTATQAVRRQGFEQPTRRTHMRWLQVGIINNYSFACCHWDRPTRTVPAVACPPEDASTSSNVWYRNFHNVRMSWSSNSLVESRFEYRWGCDEFKT